MQGVERPDRELFDAAALVGQLIPPGSMFAFLARHRGELFPDKDFADLFSADKGRASIPATVMAAVMTLQTLHDKSDRETAEAVRFDLRWKVAIGASLVDAGFDASTLVYWRRRIARSDRPHRINEAVRKIVQQTGILAGRRRRAIDSTILDDAVATQDTVTQLISAIRRVMRQVPGAAQQVATLTSGYDYSKPGKPSIDWDDPDAKDALVSALVNDANALVAALADEELDEAAAGALALLALVAGQDVEPAPGSDGTDGRWRIARKVAPDRVISTVDPDARHTRKSPQTRRDGYRAHLAADPDTGIITDEALTKATGTDNSEPAVAEQFLANDTTTGTQAPTGTDDSGNTSNSQATDPTRREWYGDSAYGTGDLRGAIHDAGHEAIIKPKPVKPPVPGGFTLEDFTIDQDSQTATCPAGVTRSITARRSVIFGIACRSCPLRARCTTSNTGRTLNLHKRDDLLRRARRDWKTNPDLPDRYRRHRPHIERVVAQVATWRGRRLTLRYRGTARNHAWLKRRTAALNLRNLIGRGLTHQRGTWTLAST